MSLFEMMEQTTEKATSRFYKGELVAQVIIAPSEQVARILFQQHAEQSQLPMPTILSVSEKEPIVTQIQAYQNAIKAHDWLYDQMKPIITDSEYDALYAKLKALEAKYPQYKGTSSPTEKIETVIVTALEKVMHTTPILSLDKVTTDEGIIKFLEQAPNEPVIAQNKEDGLTVVGTYEHHKQQDFITRGTGSWGERVKHSVGPLSNLPKEIDFAGKLELRFEVVVPFEAFNRVNVDGKYSNPRNLAAGSVRTLDGSLAKERGLKAYVIEVISVEGMEFEFDSERYAFVESLGFEISKPKRFTPAERNELIAYINSYDTDVRPTIPHMIDGLVIKFDRLSLRDKLGFTSKFPRWAIAYKFASQDAITQLEDIIVQIGKTGQLTPVAEFKMVDIDGVKISRATLHNFPNIQSKDIRVFDEILVARANDVIPQVIKSFTEKRLGKEIVFEVPTNCPECGTPTKYIGENLYCPNKQCEPQLIGQLEHFVSREALNIDGLGEKTVADLYERGFVKTFSDIYKLHQHKSALLQIEGFGEKKYEKMIAGIEASKQQPLQNVLYGLSINLIGNTASKAIAKVYSSMQEILDAAKNTITFEATLQAIPDFGEKMVAEMVAYFQSEQNVKVIQELLQSGLTMRSDYVKPSENAVFKGMTFVITGTLSKDRKSFASEIEANGGKVSGSVSKKTTYLLMADDAQGSSKHQKALELGVKIINEAEYYSLLK